VEYRFVLLQKYQLQGQELILPHQDVLIFIVLWQLGQVVVGEVLQLLLELQDVEGEGVLLVIG
jgi:hypothetical protein